MKREHCAVGQMRGCLCGPECGQSGMSQPSGFQALIKDAGNIPCLPKYAPLPQDLVTLPKHYARHKIEPITFICENKLDFFQGNIVKYVTRHDAKGGVEDLQKAKRYLEMYIKYLQGDEGWAK